MASDHRPVHREIRDRSAGPRQTAGPMTPPRLHAVGGARRDEGFAPILLARADRRLEPVVHRLCGACGTILDAPRHHPSTQRRARCCGGCGSWWPADGD